MIGKIVTCGWNGGMALGGRMCHAIYNEVVIEAFGKDWVVVRMNDETKQVYATTFDKNLTPEQIVKELED